MLQIVSGMILNQNTMNVKLTQSNFKGNEGKIKNID